MVTLTLDIVVVNLNVKSMRNVAVAHAFNRLVEVFTFGPHAGSPSILASVVKVVYHSLTLTFN